MNFNLDLLYSQHRRESSATIPVPKIFRSTDDHAPNSNDVDAFEHILEVTKYQEAVIAFYYLDDDNKMKMTQIFDLTNSENASVLSMGERSGNDQPLGYDSDWEVNHAGKMSRTLFLSLSPTKPS